MNYNPNLVYCGRNTKQTVRCVFGLFEYRRIIETTVRGNCLGLDIIQGAIEHIYEDLPLERESSFLILGDAQGDISNEDNCLLTSDDEGEESDWLSKMLISAEITDIVPDGKL
jgi:hypothetical protein